MASPSKPTFKQEPAVWIGTIAALVVTLLSVFDVIVDVDTVTTILVAAAPLISAIAIRFKVTPVA